jgi:hypothetical protein
MRSLFIFTRPALFIAAAVLGASSSSRADLVAGWDFQGSTTAGGPYGTVIVQPPNTPKVFNANAGIFRPASQLFFDGTNGSSNFFVGTANADSELGALNGINANTAGTEFSQVTNQVGSLAMFNRAAQGGIDGKSAVFKLSMDGYQGLQFSFAVQRPVSGTNDYGVSRFDFSYSIDGTNYTPWGTIDTGFATSVINTPFSLSPTLEAVNDADLVFIKMTMSGTTAALPQGSINSTRLDNIQFNATAVPEPATALLLAFGVAGMAFRRRRTVG